jgi:hypothetical protein
VRRVRIWASGGVACLVAAAYAGCGDPIQVMRNQLGGGGAPGDRDGGFAADGNGTGASGDQDSGSVLIDSGSDPADSGDQDSSRLDPDAGCASETVTGDLKPANLLFVVDRSGSMNCNLPEDGQTSENCAVNPTKLNDLLPSKWELTRTALGDAFDSLAQGGVPVSVGLTMFPVAESRCDVATIPDVPLAPLDATHNALLHAVLAGVVPDGETPFAGATILSHEHLRQQLVDAGTLTGNTFVVLLTDGYETCAVHELPNMLNVVVPQAYEYFNFRTFVIGAPGSEGARALLSQVAWAGQTASDPNCNHDGLPEDVGDCHFDMTTSLNFADDLASTLEQISGTVLTCELDVPTNPTGEGVDLTKVNVDVNEVGYFSTDCSVEGNSGWQYSDDQTRIILCGAACDAAMQENAAVSIVLGCPTRVPE